MTVAVDTHHTDVSVAVIGGGPAGLMAAEVLATAGLQVTLYEAHRSVGRKFLLAGRSGLNLTHDEPLETMLGRYTPTQSIVSDAVKAFPPAAVRAWADGLGAETFVGTSGRVFPTAMRAAPLLRSWIERLNTLGVVWKSGHRFLGWSGAQLRFASDNGEVAVAHSATILCFGGASWPRVSSAGEWTKVVEDQGWDIDPLRSSNAGLLVDWSAVFRDRFEGTPVKNVVVGHGDRSQRGELMITRSGLEGGPVYALSALVGAGSEIVLDLAPDLDSTALSARLDRRRAKDSLSTVLRKAGLAPVAIGLLRESTGNVLPTRTGELAALIRQAPISVVAPAPIERAISTAGGLCLDELSPSFMVLDRPGVFAAGEMLDWDAPTGGYLLQACLSTAVAAAGGVQEYLTV